jgi:hypothetical protein
VETEPISARYEWNSDEMAEALASHQRASVRPFFRALIYLLLLLYLLISFAIPLGMVLRGENPPETRRNGIIALVAVGLIWAWAYHAVRTRKLLRWQARRVFRSKRGGAEWVEWSITPEDLSNRTALSASTILWPMFVRVVEAPKGFMLYQSIQLFNWIPAHAFASESEMRRFAELARGRVEDFKVLGSCQYPGKPDAPAPDEF